MNKKALLFSLLAIGVLAAIFLFFWYGRDRISADTVMAPTGNAELVTAVQTEPILIVDDDATVVTENQALSVRMKIKFPPVGEKIKTLDGVEITPGPLYYLVGKLANAIGSDGKEVVLKDNFAKKIDNRYVYASNKKKYSPLASQEYTVNVNVPSGVFKDNNIFSKLTLYSCTSKSSRCDRKIAEVTHETTIDYSINNVDLSVKGGIAATFPDFLIPGKTNQEVTAFDLSYLNNSKSVARDTIVKFYMPKGAFEIQKITDMTKACLSISPKAKGACSAQDMIEILTDTIAKAADIPFTKETATIGEGDAAKEYDVAIINIGALKAFGTGSIRLTAKSLLLPDMTGNTIVNSFAKITTGSNDNNPSNDKVDYQVYFGIFTASRSQ